MTKNEVQEMFTLQNSTLELTCWLRDVYFPQLLERFNKDSSRKRFGLFQNETIPTNERNLGDVRTRMGLLIEFELARISNEILPELGINDIFWSYVVANRFPDLEIRRNTGERLIRLEIKCLQCIAEEKAANFSTLRKDIDPNTDFVIVCLWDWVHDTSPNCDWDSAPRIMKIYVFNAYSLALLRDTYWLNKPPKNLGKGYQGFDIRFAVTCENNYYSKEQGNYGKLTRIWNEDFEYRPNDSDILLDTEKAYLLFTKEIVRSGFVILAKRQLMQMEKSPIEPIYSNNVCIGYKAQNIAYVFDIKTSVSQIIKLINDVNVNRIVKMTEKYKSTIWRIGDKTVEMIEKDQKPKNIVDIINLIKD